MILKKYRERAHLRKNFKVPVDQLLERLTHLRSKTENLVLCPKPTGYNWRGVYNASLGLFSDLVFEIPQYYSTPVYTTDELKVLGEKIASLNFKNVIFSGYLPYFENIITPVSGKTKVGVIYHGFLSELSDNPFQVKIFNHLLESLRKGIINKLAFNKKGLAETVETILKVESFHIILKTPVISGTHKKADETKTHIGVLVNNQFRKNFYNQVAAGLMMKNSIVHVPDTESKMFFGQYDRVATHKFPMEHHEFLKLLGTNDLNMYVTYSESWGLVATESIAQGVPCLVSNNSGIMDYDDELAKYLVVKEFDNSLAIAKQAEYVLQNKEWISDRCISYTGLLNTKADEKLSDFLDA